MRVAKGCGTQNVKTVPNSYELSRPLRHIVGQTVTATRGPKGTKRTTSRSLPDSLRCVQQDNPIVGVTSACEDTLLLRTSPHHLQVLLPVTTARTSKSAFTLPIHLLLRSLTPQQERIGEFCAQRMPFQWRCWTGKSVLLRAIVSKSALLRSEKLTRSAGRRKANDGTGEWVRGIFTPSSCLCPDLYRVSSDVVTASS
jgi:hypothetical protein